MPSPRMNLKVLLPFQVFIETSDVIRIVTETREGSFGLLPQRLDCTAALLPGILVYETVAGEEIYLAIDQGILVKAGPDVFVSVRRALTGTDLAQLHAAVEQEFLTLDEDQQSMRLVMAKLESRFLRRLASFEYE